MYMTANYASALNNLSYGSGYPTRQVLRIERQGGFGCRLSMAQLDLRGWRELLMNNHDGQVYTSGMAANSLEVVSIQPSSLS